jgi:hypothetical protein
MLINNLTDRDIANMYVAKGNSAAERGLEFSLSFNEFKALYYRSTCYYSGVRLTMRRKSLPLRSTDATLERMDNGKGYVTGNVKLVCHYFNNLKSALENGECGISFNAMRRFSKNACKGK